MKATEGKIGRVFFIRLEDGDIIPDCIEEFSREKGITTGHAVIVGGAGSGQVVVGPRDSEEMPPDPIMLPVDGAHEILASGIIAPDQEGNPVLHIHGALGRSGNTLTGCLRPGVTTWLVGEVVLYEILDTKAERARDERSGFDLLSI
jgi:uncharacterized protein